MINNSGRVVTATALLLAGALTALTACSGGSGGNAGGDVDEVKGEIAYSFWGSTARADKVASITQMFGEEYPDAAATPEVAEYNAYIERMTVRAAGKDLACATGTQSLFVTQYAKNGALRPLDDLIDGGQLQTDNIPEDILKSGEIEGTMYLFPTSTSMRLLAYNADMVTAAGVEEPDGTWTWEEYADWLRDLQTKLPAGVYASEIEGSNLFTLMSYAAGHGYKPFDGAELGFPKEVLKDWFTLWTDLTDEGVTIRPDTIADQLLSLELTPLATGKVASATRDIPHIYITETALSANGLGSSVVGVANPTEDPDQSANVTLANGISIPETCDNVGTAAAFIDYFANDIDAGKTFQSDNGVVSNTDVQDALLEDPTTPDGVKRNITTLQSFLEDGNVTTTDYPAGVSVMATELRRIYEDLAFGRSTVDQAVEEFFSTAERTLK